MLIKKEILFIQKQKLRFTKLSKKMYLDEALYVQYINKMNKTK